MKQKFGLLTLSILLAFLSGCKQNNDSGNSDRENSAINIDVTGDYEVAEITAAPLVPKPVGNRSAKKLIVNLETTETQAAIADSINYTFWTFNDIVPGSFIRIREGDEIQLNIKNNENSALPHNIDLHAVNGQEEEQNLLL